MDYDSINKSFVAPESSGSMPADLTDSHWMDAHLLHEWLGSFWSEACGSRDLVATLQQARALRIAQLYLDLLEAIKLQDRSGAPVFHRERWHPVAIRRSTRNTGRPEMFRLGKDGMVLGRQTDSSEFPKGTEFELGSGRISVEGAVFYPFDEASLGLKSAATCATNRIADATVVLSPDHGFRILDGGIEFSAAEDPFEGEHADEFPKFEVATDDPKSPVDEEAVVWICDGMFDKGFIDDHLGYAIGLSGESSEVYKRVVNAAWNAVASGCTPLILTSLMACICGLPTVREDGEVVESIERSDDATTVVTSKNVYRLHRDSVLKPGVVRGAELKRFDTLESSVRVYPYVREADRLHLWSEFADEEKDFRDDVGSIDLPPSLFRCGVEEGFSVGWEDRDVYCNGFDANGNPKLWFYLDGLESDNTIFWESVWAGYESAKVSMASVLPCSDSVINGTLPEPGKSVGKTVTPIDFFLKNLVGANTLIITVRTDTLPEDAPLRDPKFFGVLRDCVPACTRLYVIEHAAVWDDWDAEDGGQPEDEFSASALENASDSVDSEDSTSWKFVPSCTVHGAGKVIVE